MIKTRIHCKVLSPMFSYGSDKNKPELRVSELKGLIRFIFRIAQVGEDCKDVNDLLIKENELFGDAEKSASPLKLSMRFMNNEKKTDEYRILMHKKFDKNNRKDAIKTGTKIEIDIRTINKITEKKHIEYVQMIQFALLLGGMGNRMRRGRGALEVESIHSDIESLNGGAFPVDRKELKIFIEENLKNQKFSKDRGKGNTIIITKQSKRKWPQIEKIVIGEQKWGIKSALETIDLASHKVNKENHPSIYTGYVITKDKEIFNEKDNRPKTLKKGARMASPIIVSPIKLNDGIHLLYTFITPIFEENDIATFREDKRDEFLELIEKK